MRILHITPSYKPAYTYGGPIVSVSHLCEAQANLGHDVVVYSTTANGKNELDVPLSQSVNVDGVTVWYFPRITRDHTHISPALWRHLWHTVGQYEGVHVHSWWNFLVLGAVLVCWMRGVRLVFSPRGMLSTYSFMRENSFKKTLIHRLLGKCLLSKTFLHATTDLEWRDAHRVIPHWKGFIAPNLIQLPSMTYSAPVQTTFTLGFLSRIDAKKGVDFLIRALGQVTFPFRLRIAGSGEVAYVQSLKDLAQTTNIADRLEWVGWKNREEKYQFLSEIDLFVLTSYNENFANSVLEALAVGTPVLISDRVGLGEEVLKHQWGWVCSLSEEEISGTLTKAYLNASERLRIRKEAPDQVRQVFDSNIVTEKYLLAYRELL